MHRLFFLCLIPFSLGCAARQSPDQSPALFQHPLGGQLLSIDKEVVFERPTGISWILQEQAVVTGICVEDEVRCSFRLRAVRGVDERRKPSVWLSVHYVLERLPQRREGYAVAWLPSERSRYFYRSNADWREIDSDTDAFVRENQFVHWLWRHIKAENEKR